MKTPRVSLLALLAVSSLFAAFARADEAAYARILQAREAVLSRILADREARYKVGAVDPEAIVAARLALITFRRDTAATKAGKIQQQELIVALHEKKLATLTERAKTGLSGPDDILLATEALLAAQQTLEELHRDGK